MTIRKATLEDSEFIATLILLAMEEIIFRFIDDTDYNKAKKFMLHFTASTGNQYSYENCWVAEADREVIATVCIYNGARLSELREPIIRFVREQFGKDLNIEDETQSGEYYIDSLGVNPNRQGQGVATKILQFLFEEYVLGRHQALGLLVDEDNPRARRLYLKLGFEAVGSKNFAGRKMTHLQMKPQSFGMTHD